jgi:hypothetical protein
MQGEPIDGVLLRLLSDVPGPWQMTELEREVGEPRAVRDAVGRLVGAGLAHRMKGGFLIASAAGRHADEIGER